jgi:Flp pilus assembly protein CpaB
LAAGLALAAMVLIAAYLTNYKRHVQSGEGHVSVYAAAKAIPAGTAGADLVKQGYVHKTTVLERNLVPGFVAAKTDPSTFQGLYITRPLFKNEQLSLESLGKPSARGVQGQLVGVDRAIEVKGTPTQLLAGTLRDGDHVDVVGAWELKAGGSQNDDIRVGRVILRDLLVLRAPVTGAKGALSSSSSDTVTAQLKLSDTQSRQFFWMDRFGEWTLVLRSPVDSADSKDGYDDARTLLIPAFPKQVQAALHQLEQKLYQQLTAAAK